MLNSVLATIALAFTAVAGLLFQSEADGRYVKVHPHGTEHLTLAPDGVYRQQFFLYGQTEIHASHQGSWEYIQVPGIVVLNRPLRFGDYGPSESVIPHDVSYWLRTCRAGTCLDEQSPASGVVTFWAYERQPN